MSNNRILPAEEIAPVLKLTDLALAGNRLGREEGGAPDGLMTPDSFRPHGEFQLRDRNLPSCELQDLKMAEVDRLEVWGRIKSDVGLKYIEVSRCSSLREASVFDRNYLSGLNVKAVKPATPHEFTKCPASPENLWQRQTKRRLCTRSALSLCRRLPKISAR